MKKQNRLRRNEDFQKVYRFGKSRANRQFVIYYLKNEDQDDFRLGISASKKVAKAVGRNRIKRTLKEIVRLNEDRIRKSYDFIIIVRKPAVDMEYDQMQKSLFHVLKKTEMYMK